ACHVGLTEPHTRLIDPRHQPRWYGTQVKPWPNHNAEMAKFRHFNLADIPLMGVNRQHDAPPALSVARLARVTGSA
ncbi:MULTISPECIES: hypothetical protein, partial [unclassified Sphingomonas]|uniref:hypothetical protein n=1 Tax=unclassified Sphingomonas TaxID=196159 RepID=UPI00226A4C2D